VVRSEPLKDKLLNHGLLKPITDLVYFKNYPITIRH